MGVRSKGRVLCGVGVWQYNRLQLSTSSKKTKSIVCRRRHSPVACTHALTNGVVAGRCSLLGSCCLWAVHLADSCMHPLLPGCCCCCPCGCCCPAAAALLLVLPCCCCFLLPQPAHTHSHTYTHLSASRKSPRSPKHPSPARTQRVLLVTGQRVSAGSGCFVLCCAVLCCATTCCAGTRLCLSSVLRVQSSTHTYIVNATNLSTHTLTHTK